MDRKSKRLFALFAILPFLAAIVAGEQAQKSFGGDSNSVPKSWDADGFASFDVPLADSKTAVRHASAADYYSIPLRKIYKTYPIYAPGREPAGYIAWLKQQEPELVFDPSRMKTQDDWIKAGELIFDAPITYNSLSTVAELNDHEWYKKMAMPVTREGIMPFFRYVVRKTGQVDVGEFSCGMCHSRVMPDGSAIKGAQGNMPFDRLLAYGFRKRADLEAVRRVARILFAAPWVRSNPDSQLERMSLDQIASVHEAIPPGAISRFGTSPFYPPQVPDLIGVKDRRYLDHTGLMRHRTVEDLMRYSAINQGGDVLDRFGDFTPLGTYPDPRNLARYSDENLFALVMYLYSLKPPPNPNKFGPLAERGHKIFIREGCVMCHTPPLYTNNKLTPVEGFEAAEDHAKKLDIMPIIVGTDSNLALNTRRGTGYYKVPSLKGVWYRGPFEHNGSVATLEDWLSPRRTRDDYNPASLRRLATTTGAVKGHPFGLDLREDDRNALVAFLKTL
jgi:hypothetical protein